MTIIPITATTEGQINEVIADLDDLATLIGETKRRIEAVKLDMARNERLAEHERLLLTVKESAERLGISVSTAYGLIRTGALHSVKIGNARRVPRQSVEAFLTQIIHSNGGVQ